MSHISSVIIGHGIVCAATFIRFNRIYAMQYTFYGSSIRAGRLNRLVGTGTGPERGLELFLCLDLMKVKSLCDLFANDNDFPNIVFSIHFERGHSDDYLTGTPFLP